ncbi:DUF2892 domain-containing protein [Nocardia gipuzkoensis]|uniref:YgaP family membrane protein n=1 Tax=Nocardia gipuzkoensis TaxID=2749991 RepID=UPI001E2B29C9|nr:DUF2892 domain-containing protein [Nocardia gipuzkoensis]UGT67931.1 DUF2892 domain-containing protein [Nocardia gipuzkoensis]
MVTTHRHQGWTIERIVPLLGGTMVFVSLALVLAVSPWWLLLTAFVAANLLLYSALGWCPVTLVLQRLGVPRLNCPVAERDQR